MSLRLRNRRRRAQRPGANIDMNSLIDLTFLLLVTFIVTLPALEQGVSIILPQAKPNGVPFEYVMQPCEVKLKYLGTPWFTVSLEIGHNEIGDADASDLVEMPETLAGLCDFLCLRRLPPIPAMRLEHQAAQKLHGVSAPGSRRAHDLIDLQLIFANGCVDIPLVASLCRALFKYRQVHAWPPRIAKGDGWEEVYNRQRGKLSVLESVDEAIAWANELIEKIDKA